MIYTGRQMRGSVSPGHMIDLAIAGILAAGAATTIAPADYRAMGVAAIGAIIGGLIAARMFRDETQPLEWMWGVSTLASVAFSPFLFDYLSIPVYDSLGQLIRAEILPRSVSAMLALSTAVAMGAWGTLKAIHAGWTRYVKRRIENAIPPKRERDEHEDGGP
jgi:hypothetical protein